MAILLNNSRAGELRQLARAASLVWELLRLGLARHLCFFQKIPESWRESLEEIVSH